ncbi:MAG: DNA repair protein RadC [Cyclobacteriaceae bacterium]|nr:DNA repair protein RadC [Cyclobacteriaceae bacterium]
MESPLTGYLRIPQWAEEDRPREKLLLKGRSALSDAELLAILLGTGMRSMSAVDVAKQLLQTVNFDLNELARCSVHDLMKQKGIGQAKAITIVSALEFGKRRKETNSISKPTITSSGDVFELLHADLQDLPHEEFWIIILNRANRVIRKWKISSGGISGTVADPRLIFKTALDLYASSIILVHNHPSGAVKPSQADISLTKKLKQAGELLEIPVLDHIIYGEKEYFSFADEGLL